MSAENGPARRGVVLTYHELVSGSAAPSGILRRSCAGPRANLVSDSTIVTESTMARLIDPPSTSTVGNHELIVDSQDLRSAIVRSLAETPVDEESLRRNVWTFVSAERDAGTPPGHVIMALTDLVEAADISPIGAHQPLMRRVILWCVEAYFGHVGGDVVGRDRDSLGDLPMLVSNR